MNRVTTNGTPKAFDRTRSAVRARGHGWGASRCNGPCRRGLADRPGPWHSRRGSPACGAAAGGEGMTSRPIPPLDEDPPMRHLPPLRPLLCGLLAALTFPAVAGAVE